MWVVQGAEGLTLQSSWKGGQRRYWIRPETAANANLLPLAMVSRFSLLFHSEQKSELPLTSLYLTVHFIVQNRAAPPLPNRGNAMHHAMRSTSSKAQIWWSLRVLPMMSLRLKKMLWDACESDNRICSNLLFKWILPILICSAKISEFLNTFHNWSWQTTI